MQIRTLVKGRWGLRWALVVQVRPSGELVAGFRTVGAVCRRGMGSPTWAPFWDLFWQLWDVWFGVYFLDRLEVPVS